MEQRLSLLRAALIQEHLDGFILPVNDEFMGEYVPACAQRLRWLTGFTGSAGLAVVLASVPEGSKQRAAFFTDGRYTLQAQAEISGYELHNSADCAPDSWLAAHAPKGAVIGYDPRLHTLHAIERYQRKAEGKFTLRPVSPNPVDALWEGRPTAPYGAVQQHPLRYAGEESESKRARMAEAVAMAGADAALITAPDSVCWLLNIRGDDVPFTPFVLCFALLSRDFGRVFLFVDPARVTEDVRAHLGEGVEIHHPDKFAEIAGRFRGGKLLYDPASSPVWFHQQLTALGASIVKGTDPCLKAKACKNTTELEGARAAHQRDGLAVTRFLFWLDKAVAEGSVLTECTVAEKLEKFRREHALYREPSFATIAGSGPNGAIVHYHATKANDRSLAGDALLLLDSGGQYPDGTTDITRTIAIGTPSQEMKERFTQVLKGHIALASAVFPKGTAGSQLDTLARQFLWHAGQDYDHGTGHGVGSYLSVHEGPQRISKRAGDEALTPGMILSNEPGYYKAGAYGIRIENLVVVKEHAVVDGKHFYAFDTLTLAPIDMRLVEDSLLNAGERQWLLSYHQAVYKTHAPNLTPQEQHWLSCYSA